LRPFRDAARASTAVLALLAACSKPGARTASDAGATTPTVHGGARDAQGAGIRGPLTTRFAARVDVAPLLAAGCVMGEKGLDCTRGELRRLGCIGPSVVVDALGALTPNAAIATCDGDERGGLDEGIAVVGCGLAATTRRYVVASEGKVTLIRSEAELVARFAPVETPEEALAFVLATSPARALTEVVVPPGAKRYVASIEPTSVETTPEGFRVRVFDVRVCGCGPHDWEAIDVLVTRAGRVHEIGRERIYAEPELRGACVD
jgi:hypothetical protein